MKPKSISVVINTGNSASTIKQTLESVKWAGEIVILDSHSQDKTLDICKQYTNRIYLASKKFSYVEPLRNEAIKKAKNDWILVVDADEEIPPSLVELLREKTTKQAGIYELPRKNIIFNKWIQHTGWWPDYQLRFFKKGTVSWPKKIHAKPQIKQASEKIPSKEKFAVIHHNYHSLDQFIGRLNNYTTAQAEKLSQEGKIASPTLLLKETIDEFLRRFFLYKGYKDGFHGFALSLLQSFSQAVTILKLWQLKGFKDSDLMELKPQAKQSLRDIRYWMLSQKIQETKGINKMILKFKRKFKI